MKKFFKKALVVIAMSYGSCLFSFAGRGEWMSHMLHAGEVSSAISCDYQNDLAQTLAYLFSVKSYQDVKAAYKAAQLLENYKKDNAIENDKNKDFELFVINTQQKWLLKCAHDIEPFLGFFDKSVGYLYDLWARFMTFIGYKGCVTLTLLAQEIYKYAVFERTVLFSDYQATLHWLDRQKRLGFPTLLMFWRDHEIKHTLISYIKNHHLVLKPLSFIADASEEVLVGVDAGETVATEAALQETVEASVVADLVKPLENTTLSSTTSETMETDIDAAIKEASDSALAASSTSTESTALKSLVGIRGLGTKALDSLWSGLNAIKQSVVNFYKGSFVSKVIKTIADTYEQFLEAPYKKYIYDTLIAPIENNPLNNALKNVPSYLKMPIDITIQLETMQGGGLVPAWVDQANATLFSQYADQNSKTTEAFKAFQATVTANQTASLQAGWASFVDVLNSYIAQQKIINDKHQLQLNVMSQQILKLEPQSYYLDSANSFALDEQFSLSKMYNTPALTIPKQDVIQPFFPGIGSWYNIFRKGNWQYISNEKAFYQVAPIVALKAPDQNDSSALTVAQQAEYSTIFTEYYPQNANREYTISGSFNITGATYPFFVGVLCNQARWISGIPDRLRQQRFVGLYGALDKTVYAVIVESIPSTQAELAQNVPSMKSPFYLLMNNPIANFTQQVIVQNNISLPLPFMYSFTITTQPTQLTFSLVNNSQPNSTTINLTKTNMSATVFKFHGIGLISAGAAASFTIQEPHDLGFIQSAT